MTINEGNFSRRLAIQALGTGLAPVAVKVPSLSASKAEMSSGNEISVMEFGASADGETDDTAAFERAISAAQKDGRRLRIPAGRYVIARTLVVNRGIQINGDGVERTILLGAVGKAEPIFHIHAKETDSIIGLHMGGFKLICNHGSTVCDGIKLSTAGNGAAINQCSLRDLFIINAGSGVTLSGVIYRTCFENITVSGFVSQYGFYCDDGFVDVTFNSFWNLEVTGVASGAYAYWIHSNFSNFINLTADGCCYFSSPGGAIRNLAIETILAGTPPSQTAVQLNQVQIIDGINLVGVQPAKCRNGLHCIGQALVVSAVRFVAPQPDRALILDPASEGVLSGVYIERAAERLEDYTASGTLDRWVLQGASAITARQLSYSEGEWEPALAGWATPPEIKVAMWEKIGRRMFVSITGRGGVLRGQSATISLPLAAAGGNSAILNVATRIGTIDAQMMTDFSSIVVAAPFDLGQHSWQVELTLRI